MLPGSAATVRRITQKHGGFCIHGGRGSRNYSVDHCVDNSVDHSVKRSRRRGVLEPRGT